MCKWQTDNTQGICKSNETITISQGQILKLPISEKHHFRLIFCLWKKPSFPLYDWRPSTVKYFNNVTFTLFFDFSRLFSDQSRINFPIFVLSLLALELSAPFLSFYKILFTFKLPQKIENLRQATQTCWDVCNDQVKFGMSTIIISNLGKYFQKNDDKWSCHCNFREGWVLSFLWLVIICVPIIFRLAVIFSVIIRSLTEIFLWNQNISTQEIWQEIIHRNLWPKTTFIILNY